MNAAEIAARLGDAKPEGKGWWRTTCTQCGKPNLCLRDNPNGRVKLFIKCWAGCDEKLIRADLKRQHFLNGAAPPETQEEREAREAAERLAAVEHQRKIEGALDTWRNSLSITENTPPAVYLAGRLLNSQPEIPAVLRYVPALYHPFEKRSFPALIALVQHQEHEPTSIHCVFLNPLDPTSKLAIEHRKLSFGEVSGGAVRLFPAGNVLALGEGIEDCLAFTQEHGIPAWAAISTTGIENFVPPPRSMTPTLILLEDEDISGRKAVDNGAAKLAAAGYAVKIARPLRGKDVNECLRILGPGKPLVDFETYQLSPEFSDDHLALLFSRRHGSDLRYVALWGKWLQWIQTHWRQEDTLKAFDFARALCREIANSADDKLKNGLTDSSTIAAVERLARGDRRQASTVGQWDADDWLFNPPAKENK
jgi:hypothetical protein